MKKHAKRVWLAGAMVLLAAGFGAPASAEPTPEESLAAYRDMMADDNPAELWLSKGETLWKQPRGPAKASLERCDLGLGAGVVKGAYAQLPRYFADTGKVQDLESRLVTCMTSLQGMTRNDAEKDHFSSDGRNSDMEALVAWIASESSGLPMAAPQQHPKEKEAYAIGEKLFFYRAGPHDFACSTCHSTSGMRVRLQQVANLTVPAEAQKIYTAWPAYRVSQGTVRSMENRLLDCLRQQRMPVPAYTSEAVIAITEYLAVQAKGGAMAAPGLKR